MVENAKTIRTAFLGIVSPYLLDPIVHATVQHFADLINSGLQFIIGVVAIYRILKNKETKNQKPN